MNAYKEWHDEKNVFFRELKLHFGQCDLNQKLSLPELLLITSDTAVEDYFQRGMSFDVLLQNGVVILLSRLVFKIHRFPKAEDRIILKTWEDKPERGLLSRKYELEGEDGTKLISGNSLWLIANPATRRLIKPAAFTLREEPDFVIPVDCPPCGKIPQPENMEKLGEKEAGYSDMDANGHMNNSRYAAFIMDFLPEKLHQKEVEIFKINFAKEARKGDIISIYGNVPDTEDSNKITITGKTQNHVCFESEILFK